MNKPISRRVFLLATAVTGAGLAARVEAQALLDEKDGTAAALGYVADGLKRIKAADPKWDVSAWEKIARDAEARVKKGEQAVAAKDAAKSELEQARLIVAAKSLKEGLAKYGRI